MKKNLLLWAVMVSIPLLSYGQDENYSYRYGKILDSELSMDKYDRDTSASAVFIYEKVDIYYELGHSFQLIREYSAKIKILNNDGTSWADVEIPCYEESGTREIVSGIDATAYNLENGKVVKTQLKKQMIFREKVSDNIRMIKFSVPDVRAGTVIEYKYKINSDFLTNIPDLEIQHSIPVIYSLSRVKIPEWFFYSKNQSGFHNLNVRLERNNERRTVGGEGISFTVDENIFEAEHMPALKEEPYVWCLEDMKTRMEFEMTGYRFPHGIYHSFSTTWESVYESLDKTDFQRFLKMSCPFSDVVKTIKESTDDPVEQARAILKHVQSTVKWNKTYTLIGDQPRNAYKEGTGTSAAINFLIISGLRECGIPVAPVLLNPRSAGRIPLSRPTLQKINAFVVMIEVNGQRFFLDGTNPYSDVGVLPANLLVDRARIFGISGEMGWVNLSESQNSLHRHFIRGEMEPDGKINVEHSITLNNQLSIPWNEKYFGAESEEKYIESVEEKQKVTIDEYKISGAGTSFIVEELKYAMQAEKLGDEILIKSAMIDFMGKNILTEQQRQLPIEMEYPYTVEIIYAIALPENLTVEKLPENINLTACENGLSFLHMFQKAGNLFSARLVMKISRPIFGSYEYDDMRTFFGMISDRSNERIVITQM